MTHDNNILGFANELVPLVKDGSKTFTYRLGHKWGFLKKGDILSIENTSTHLPFAEIEIVEVSGTLFADLPIDRLGHEHYSSKEDQRKIFETYYQKPVLDSDPVLVIEFKVLRLLD